MRKEIIFFAFFVFLEKHVILSQIQILNMEVFLTVFIITLSSLYLFDRLFNIIKCFIKGEKFEQKWYQRILSFLSLASLITLLIV